MALQGLPVTVVAKFGLPVSQASAPFGLPVTVALNGMAVTPVASGGMAVFDLSGTLFSGIRLSNASFTAGSAAGTAIGTLSVVGGTGTYTFTLTGGTVATWDPATVTAVTLSGGNLVATNTGTSSADQGARVADAGGKTTGKYYFEVTTTAHTGGGNVGTGVGTTASTYTNMGGGGQTGAICFSAGSIYTNFSNTGATAGVVSPGDVRCVAVDLDNRKIWFRKGPSGIWNNSAGNDPATNVGGITISAGTMVPFQTFGGGGGLANNIRTANFGPAFTGLVPSGFTAGWLATDPRVQLAGTNGVNLQVGPTPSAAGTFSITVHADNGAGSVFDQAFTISAVQIPANTVLPVISGTTTVGSVLTTTDGTWTGYPVPSYTYQWKRGGVNIAGATTSAYLLVSADLAAMITVTVTATNTAGNASATSAAVGPITAAASGYKPTYYFLGF